MSHSENECSKMEVDQTECEVERNVWRRLDSSESYLLNSVPKPSNAEDIERKQLELNCDRSSDFRIMPNANNLSTSTPSSTKSNHLSWSYDGPIPQFGPKKFPGKGFSSSIASPSDEEVEHSGFGNWLRKSTSFEEQPEPMQIDEGFHDEIKSPNDSVVPNDSAVLRANRNAKRSIDVVKRESQEEFMIIPRRSVRLLNKSLACPSGEIRH